MTLRNTSDRFMCKAFASLLRKSASDWYLRLEPDSIGSFREFGRKFTTRFANNRFRHDPADALLALRQGRNETLRDFMVRFNAELSQLIKIDIQIAVAALKHTTTDQNLKVYLTLKPPKDLQELGSKTSKIIRAKEACSRDRNRYQVGPANKKKEDSRPLGRLWADDRPAIKNTVPVFERLGYVPLKVPLSQVLFTIRDLDHEGLQVPHDDALVIRLIISNFDISKILVDTGSSVNVLHVGTFEEMKLGEERLGAAGYSIYGFSGASVQINGKIDLPVMFGTYPLQRTVMTTFLVVDVPFAYSAIIGRPALRDLGAVVSTPHLKMKFPT
ncbi:uncharacterized protein LOC143850674 [Tasmannia lanceolata]|uniref:uncharacterized protein LOC143850674 n=1 Tax=Tasmannia lanceolata TaxID=3420 RepID=UPI0040648AB7